MSGYRWKVREQGFRCCCGRKVEIKRQMWHSRSFNGDVILSCKLKKKDKNIIHVKRIKFNSISEKYVLLKKPILRGIINLFESLNLQN